MIRLPLHDLQQDRHTLVVIEQAHAAAVRQRVGIVDAGVDAANGGGERAQVLARVP